ncbi:PEP-CTERM sorting domain-containing protein [Steroidobacter flavus]|uniref:PEP-CTERM sorting domain-containing protein n=1 Tax=Steroidobacter flavus TaxID=1842136 RepID=A0ABV8SZF5_9GAMM
MTSKSWLAMSGLCLLLAMSAAQPHPITIDASSYAPGAVVGGAYEGITLSHVTFTETGLQTSAVYALGCTPETRGCDAQGTAMFGWQKANGKAFTSWNSSAGLISDCLQQHHADCYSQPQHLLEVTFDRATDFIQFDATQVTDSPWAWAFDAAGNLLPLTPTLTIDSLLGHQSLRLTSNEGNISRVLLAGNDGYSIVNRISYNGAAATAAPTTTVPEPETLALMMIGLIGVAVTTRLRRRTHK